MRAKYTLVTAATAGPRLLAEVRLPTGDEANLLGAGSAGFRLIGIGALERGPLMLSGNAGLVRGGVSDELNLGGAAAYAVHPRLSLTAEFLSRTSTNCGRCSSRRSRIRPDSACRRSG